MKRSLANQRLLMKKISSFSLLTLTSIQTATREQEEFWVLELSPRLNSAGVFELATNLLSK